MAYAPEKVGRQIDLVSQPNLTILQGWAPASSHRCRRVVYWPRVDTRNSRSRWRRVGVVATIEELAKRERVNRGYLSRALRLTLLDADGVSVGAEGQKRELELLP